jgi:hypothetical protein
MINVDHRIILESSEAVLSPYLIPEEAGALVKICRRLLPDTKVDFRLSSDLAAAPDDQLPSLEASRVRSRAKDPFGEEDCLPGLFRDL